MKLIDDLCKRDGEWSVTKIAAVVAHAMMAFVFAKVSLASGFVVDMWWVYGSFALGHAVVDKASGQFKAYKEGRLTGGDKDPTDDCQPPAPTRPV